MDDLMTLWRSKIQAIHGIVEAGEREHREIAAMAAQVGADYHGRFLVELLQNASDQAHEAGLLTSVVTVVRTPDMVAVANHGLPFNDRGLRSITSLGLSTKNPQDAIGNKGIGFKSVFQISHCPEVYSSLEANASYTDAGGLQFRMSLQPFRDEQHAQTAREMIADIIAAHGSTPDDIAINELFDELAAAAPFKFPLPLTASDLKGRLSQLGDTPPGQTLVVLPVREIPSVQKTIDAAIDELRQNGGAAALFTPSVTSIRVVDRVRELSWEIARNQVSPPQSKPGHGFLSTVRTEVHENGIATSRTWRMIERKMGCPDVISEGDARAEAEKINSAAVDLPGSGWDDVHSSPVCVAVPLPNQEPQPVSLLGAEGRVCIGLPTKDATGTPAWINAHFHGTISRTGIDLVENAYNAILFDEAVRLHESLIDDLKESERRDARRVATLAFEADNGPLADALYGDKGQAHGKVILSTDGVSYQTGAESILPSDADLDALEVMFTKIEDAAPFGFELPDIELARSARGLIESLMGDPSDDDTVASLFLHRQNDQPSLLEHAAKANRESDSGFWVPFLTWITERFTLDQLNSHEFLPVSGGGLAKPIDRVFLPPTGRNSASNDDDGEIADLPAEMRNSLRFLDDSVVPARKPDSRDLTELAAALAPDTTRGLVRRPRLDDLINDAIGPLMARLNAMEDAQALGVKLLQQAVHWIWRLSEAGRTRLTRDALRVPLLTENAKWEWTRPSSTYFGPGWLGTQIDALIAEAYGGDSKRLTVPWRALAEPLGIPTDDREAWIEAFEVMGVSRSPKMIRPRSGHRSAPLASRGGLALGSV